MSEILKEEGAFDLPIEQRPRAPRGFWLVQDWSSMASRLCESGMMQLQLHSPTALRTGLFGVPKKGSSLARIIVDRRPQNSQERRLVEIAFERGVRAGLDPRELLHHQRLRSLPHPSQLTDMVIPWDAKVIVSAEDCSDYYYLLRHPPSRVCETIVGRPVWSGSISTLGLAMADAPAFRDQGERLDLCLRAPAMGDMKSLDVAQAVHQHVLLEGDCGSLQDQERDELDTAMHESRWLTYGWPVPGSVHWQGAYVDDLLLATIQSASLNALLGIDAAQEHARIVKRVRDRYTEVGLIRKEEKAKEGLEEAEVWGCAVSSSRQTVGVSQARRGQVMRAVAVAVEGNAIVPAQMELLLGHLTYCLMFRRPLMRVLGRVYSWLAAHKHQRCAVPIPWGVRDELLSAMLVLPLAERGARDQLDCVHCPPMPPPSFPLMQPPCSSVILF
eukprot:1397250-Amphidinium_carterae.1